jgi:RNA polymerase sigma-70 factor (ECF subfamily)
VAIQKSGTDASSAPFHTTDEARTERRVDDESKLVAETLRGDRAAFGELVGRYQRLVGSVAWRYGVHGSEIEDVVSEIFIKAFGKLDRYRPEHPFSTWLYRLAVNHVIDHRRRRRNEARDELPAHLEDPRPGAAQTLERLERERLLRDALRRLKPKHRSALFLVYIEGLTVDEAAGILGLPQGTIKTRLMRGREALRKILASRHPEYFGSPS